jgi:hypothetical protein
VNDLNRERCTFARFEVKAEQLGSPAAGQRLNGGEELGPGFTQHIPELKVAILAFGDIETQPFGKCCVEIINLLVRQA